MVLIDFSHLVFRMLYISIDNTKPRKENGKLVTEDFKDFFIFKIMEQLTYIRKQQSRFGDIVICLDNSSKTYWRKDVCPLYKDGRAKSREESEVNFDEVFAIVNGLINDFREIFPFKVLEVDKAEADDIIAVIAKNFAHARNPVLILSEDKDFFQMLKYPGVEFYRPVAKKWITTEDKNIDEWLVEHVILGDEADNVFRIIDRIHFSDSFKQHLLNFGITDIDDQMQLDIKLLENEELKLNIFSSFNVYKKNRKNEDTSELDIYKDKPFGLATMWKAIEKAGSIDAFVDSHPYYRKNYEKNKILVLEEYIPEEISDAILDAFNQPEKFYSPIQIENFFSKHNLSKMMKNSEILLKGYSPKPLASLEDFGW